MVSRVNQDSHDGENEEKVFHSVFVQFGSTDQRCVDWWLSMIAHIGRDWRGSTTRKGLRAPFSKCHSNFPAW